MHLLIYSINKNNNNNNKINNNNDNSNNNILRYEAGVINWTKAELESIDRKTRKQMTIYGMLHPLADVQRLYLPRGQGGRGLKSVEDCVRLEEAGLADYVQSSTRLLIVAVAKEGLPLKEKTLTQKQLKEQKELERAEGWKNKPLHGQFLCQTEEIRDDATWDWLRKGDLKKETEGITAAQDQALRTNAIKAKVKSRICLHSVGCVVKKTSQWDTWLESVAS